MTEQMWQMVQMLMWAFGIQTTILIAIMGAFFSNVSKKFQHIENRIDKLCEKVEDIDRRLCRIEGSLATQGHCLFNQSKPEQKAQ